MQPGSLSYQVETVLPLALVKAFFLPWRTENLAALQPSSTGLELKQTE